MYGWWQWTRAREARAGRMVGKCVHLGRTEWWATAWKRDGVDFKLVNIQARRSASNEGVLVLIEGEAEKPETERVETAALSR